MQAPIRGSRGFTVARPRSAMRLVDIEMLHRDGEQVVVVAGHRRLRVRVALLAGPPGAPRGAERGAEDRERVAVRVDELEDGLRDLRGLRFHMRLLSRAKEKGPSS